MAQNYEDKLEYLYKAFEEEYGCFLRELQRMKLMDEQIKEVLLLIYKLRFKNAIDIINK